MRVALIHGLNSSHHSWSYICEKLKKECKAPILIQYDSYQRLSASIDQIIQQLPKGEPLCLVGHSLGGLAATLIAADYPELVQQLVTISSPLGGSRAAVLLHWLPGHLPVLSDIIPSSPIITRCQELELLVPTLSLISTGGHLSTSPEPNDSVVAVSSQRALRFGQKVEVKASHFEVLLSNETVQHLRKFIWP